ncbi:MAG: cyclophilin-like fold protein [Candidatus Bathyarchaeota archaeon]|jgi:hypothetical protein|nr:cyclophilin-like fold protein [Candidatus Bathyarchaeota archaeon]|tara:strand:- start:5713 stop:6087 length:375 start_codon:yes stop_codon:yes gene_type:complete
MAENVSRTPIKIVLEGVGVARGELIRILAPLTVGAIVGKLPLSGRAHVRGEGLSMIIGIRRGTEKAVDSVNVGDIAYWPMQDSLVVYFKDSKPYGPVNKIGTIYENIKLFHDLRGATRIRIDKI